MGRPKRAPYVRYRFRGRGVECGHIARLEAFRYVDGTSDSLRWCPTCGTAVRMTLSIEV
jgi:hypothetical protein